MSLGVWRFFVSVGIGIGLISSTPAIAAANIRGYFDLLDVNTGYFTGWCLDDDKPNDPATAFIYMDDKTGANPKNLIMKIPANVKREDLARAGFSPNHAFQGTLTDSAKKVKPYIIVHVFCSLDANGKNKVELSSSPKIFRVEQSAKK